jgi:hypothetical protein
MAINPETALNAPIPGMSLTTAPGDRPWENPPAMSTIEEALQFYAQRILGRERHDDVLDLLEAGLPVENFANIIQTSAVMEGRHTLDVGFLVAPAIEEMIMAVANIHGVKYITSEEDYLKENTLSAREARTIASEFFNAEEQEENLEPIEEDLTKPKGLMAKKIIEEEIK